MAVYNRIYTNEKWEQVNKYNKNLLSDYMKQIKSEGKSESSQKQYFNDARIILIYIMEELDNKPLYKLSRKSFRNMILWMQENGMSPARINRMLSTSRNLLNFGLDDDEFSEDFEDCKANPSRIRGMKKEKVRDIIFLTDKEISIIFNDLMKKEKYNQALFCAIMYDSASRRSEVYQLKRDDISEKGKISKSYVVGKRGKKYRPIYHDRTRKAYKKYMETRKDNSNELWIDKNGELLTKDALYVWVKTWRNIIQRETGQYKEFNPHSFRHSALENYSDGSHYYSKKIGKKFSLEALQLLANHSDLSTTASYLKDKSEDMLMEEFGI